MQLDDSSSEGSSSSDEDLDFLFLEAAFPEPRLLGSRLNIDDLSEIDCEQIFRQFFVLSYRLANFVQA